MRRTAVSATVALIVALAPLSGCSSGDEQGPATSVDATPFDAMHFGDSNDSPPGQRHGKRCR